MQGEISDPQPYEERVEIIKNYWRYDIYYVSMVVKKGYGNRNLPFQICVDLLKSDGVLDLYMLPYFMDYEHGYAPGNVFDYKKKVMIRMLEQ